jgi:hypothetical protein
VNELLSRVPLLALRRRMPPPVQRMVAWCEPLRSLSVVEVVPTCLMVGIEARWLDGRLSWVRCSLPSWGDLRKAYLPG